MRPLSPEDIAQLKSRLHEFYADGSKHAVYQNVPEFVREALGYHEAIDEGWRSDTPRYRYFSERISLPKTATIADVGANTGYFSLNLARSHPTCRVHAFEPNHSHNNFIREVAAAFDLPNVTARSEAWTAASVGSLGPFDTVLHLNILHHAGFDFDPSLPDQNQAFEAYAVEYLTAVRQRARQLCFQIGSNRGGDKQRPLFPYDDDLARLEWCCQILTRAGWNIRHIGIARRTTDNVIDYADLPEILLTSARRNEVRIPAFRDFFDAARLVQFPGEFYRRPLFICEAD